jgi:hypothetical protein
MANLLSVDDLFTVGVSFDMLGGYMLGRGLLAGPLDIARRTQTLIGSNPPERVSQIEARADGQVGLILLFVGFLLQASGYVALIAGAQIKTGADRTMLAVALALAAASAAWLMVRWIRPRMLRRLAVEVARANPQTNSMDIDPDASTLLSLGHHLGYPIDGTSPKDTRAAEAYARKHFGITHLSRRTE